MDAPAEHVAYEGKPVAYFGYARTEIAPLLPAVAGRVLEIGCGSGATMAWLRSIRPVGHAVGIELMPGPAATARAVFDSVATGSIEAPDGLAAAAGRFDLILALDVLEHLRDPAAVVALLRDRLAPDGCLIVSLPNIAHYSVSWPLLVSGRWRYQDEGILDRTHLRFFDEASARQLLEAAPLAIDRVDHVVRFIGLDELGLLRHRRWARWQAHRLLSRLVPRHLRVWQFLLRARPPGAAR
jgi:SAM-dependent methyltransferase